MPPERHTSDHKKPRLTEVLDGNVPNDVESLEARRRERTVQNLAAVNLSIYIEVAKKRFSFSFENYSKLSNIFVRQCILATNQSLEGRKCSFTVVQDSYLGMKEFLDFCSSEDSRAARITSFEEIDIQLGRDFLAWYLLKFPARSVNRKRYGKVASIISHYKQRYKKSPHVGDILVWPSGPPMENNPTSGYAKENMNSMVESALSDIKFVMKEMTNVSNNIDSWGIIHFRTPSIADACLDTAIWEKERKRVFNFPSDRVRAICSREIVRDACDALGIKSKDFFEIYLTLGDELSRSGTVFPSYSIVRGEKFNHFSGMSTALSKEIAIKTFRHFVPSWPLGMSREDASATISHSNQSKLRDEVHNAYKVMKHIRFGNEANPMEVGLMAYASNFYFTSATLYPFFAYVHQNTGWNAEAVLSIGSNFDEHISPDLIDPNYVVIWGWKGRNDSVVQHRSNTKSPFSVYSILRYVEKIVKRMNSDSVKVGGTIWQYVMVKNLWDRYASVTAELNITSLGIASSTFLKRHNIFLDARQTKQRVDVRRMRTTVQTRRRENDYSIFDSSTQMGHRDIDTTWRHYDGDVHSVALKNQRIREVQKNLIEDNENYSARLIESTTLQELRAAIEKGHQFAYKLSEDDSLTQQQVLHLLSPNGQTYIAACTDRTRPTWEHASDFLSPGDSCTFFNKCALCKNSRIFQETLPFIFRRVRDLGLLKAELTMTDWFKNYSAEYDAWTEILSDWSDKEQLKDAERVSFLKQYALPFNMRGAN